MYRAIALATHLGRFIGLRSEGRKAMRDLRVEKDKWGVQPCSASSSKKMLDKVCAGQVFSKILEFVGQLLDTVYVVPYCSC